MQQPPIDKLLINSDSKYALVVAAAKRARLLTDGSESMLEKNTQSEVFKPVSIALEEIAEGKLIFESPKSGIK